MPAGIRDKRPSSATRSQVTGLWPYLNVLEHVGVVADLAQLHDSVHQRLGATFALQKHKRWSKMESCLWGKMEVSRGLGRVVVIFVTVGRGRCL